MDKAIVKFGDNDFIIPNSEFYTSDHPFDVTQRNVELEYAKPSTIGNNVWIDIQVSID